jgi:hypothetical protein
VERALPFVSCRAMVQHGGAVSGWDQAVELGSNAGSGAQVTQSVAAGAKNVATSRSKISRQVPENPIKSGREADSGWR